MSWSPDNEIMGVNRFAPILWKARKEAFRQDRQFLRYLTLRFVVDEKPLALLMSSHEELFDGHDNILVTIDFEIFDIFYLRAVYITPTGRDTDCEGNSSLKPTITSTFYEVSSRLLGRTTNEDFEHIMTILALHSSGDE